MTFSTRRSKAISVGVTCENGRTNTREPVVLDRFSLLYFYFFSFFHFSVFDNETFSEIRYPGVFHIRVHSAHNDYRWIFLDTNTTCDGKENNFYTKADRRKWYCEDEACSFFFRLSRSVGFFDTLTAYIPRIPHQCSHTHTYTHQSLVERHAAVACAY